MRELRELDTKNIYKIETKHCELLGKAFEQGVTIRDTRLLIDGDMMVIETAYNYIAGKDSEDEDIKVFDKIATVIHR